MLAFMDIDPVTEGHVLVVPKEQIDHLWDVDDELYKRVMNIAKQVALRQREVLRPKRVAMAVEGFAVPHAHVHVFPINDRLENVIAAKLGQLPDDRLAAMAKKLAFE